MMDKSRKPATKHTIAVQEAFIKNTPLDWNDKTDFENATRGLVAEAESTAVYAKDGRTVWNLDRYDFMKDEKAPYTVNPSLWRQARLNNIQGLFKVTDRLYQVRGLDLTTVTFIEADNSYIVIDPVMVTETAAACAELLYKHLGRKPISAVIYSHTHVDHWGGVKGMISEEDVERGTQIFAPKGFLAATVGESTLAGTAMDRRRDYMFGTFLDFDEKGNLDSGLGKALPDGSHSLIAPTTEVDKTNSSYFVDGIELVFQLTPGTEAPAEMNIFLPQFNTFCTAENCTQVMHNLYTLRGAQVRDAKNWAAYIDQAIEWYGDRMDIIIATHHWPTWGRENCVEYLKKQRDCYRYIHDQTLRLANHGYNMTEIGNMLKLPASLASQWHIRENYGTVSHNARAVFQRYLGFYDGNPATLNELPPESAAVKYIEYMGGAEKALELAKADFEKGEYRWVATVMRHLVFAQPDNEAAKELLADSLEQLGYQSEASSWRNAYLSGAYELRNGVKKAETPTGEDEAQVVGGLNIETCFAFMSVRLNGPKADGKIININFKCCDTGDKYLLTVENSVLRHTSGKNADYADLTVAADKRTIRDILNCVPAAMDALKAGKYTENGNENALMELFGLLDTFDDSFNLVMP